MCAHALLSKTRNAAYAQIKSFVRGTKTVCTGFIRIANGSVYRAIVSDLFICKLLTAGAGNGIGYTLASVVIFLEIDAVSLFVLEIL